MSDLAHSTAALRRPLERAALAERLLELWEQTGDDALHRLARGEAPREGLSVATDQLFADWVSTSLMDCYKNTGEPEVFALLFELNRASFLQAIQTKLRRSFHHIDAHDVLQEVFLNIYRYPHRFHPDRADAFRGWGHRIARNTLLKFLKGATRQSNIRGLDEEVVQPEDVRARRPDRAVSEAESAEVVNCAYLIYLQLYLVHFAKLSARERRALSLVEVDGVSYRDAAAALGIRLENLKMVIFRGRRKIYRGMEQSLVEIGEHGPSSSPSPGSPSSTLGASTRVGNSTAAVSSVRLGQARILTAAPRVPRRPASLECRKSAPIPAGFRQLGD
ncbi:MAG: RNA polymerase sigma factor [Planctomycetes bacterium]|nr:RNA polymerase sigma factor [Planctomycetota bacterium]